MLLPTNILLIKRNRPTNYVSVHLFCRLQLLLGVFEVHAKEAQAIYKKQKAEKEAEEKKRLEAKRRKEEQLKNQSASICEVTDEEADRLQKEINAQKYAQNDHPC